jgi:hypothetical protein
MTALAAKPADELVETPTASVQLAPVPAAVPATVESTAPTVGADVVPADVVPAEVVAAERHWWKGFMIGMAIGVPVCSLLWMGIVAIAVGVMNVGWPIWPALGMAAVVGVFAGLFLGGWAGVTACAERLDEAEFHHMRH